MKSLRWPILVGIIFILGTALFVQKFDLYQVIPYLDKYFHLIGGAVLGWFFIIYFKNDFSTGSKHANFRYIVAVIGAAAMVGVMWEFAERLSTLYAPSWFKHYFYGGNLADTLKDLVADMIGALVATIFSRRLVG